MGSAICFLVSLVLIVGVSAESSGTSIKLVTQTVYGFLDFVTTIGNTVMIFSPESAPLLGLKDKDLEIVNVIETKPIKSLTKGISTHISPSKLVISDIATEEDSQLMSVKKNFKKSNETVLFKQNQNNEHSEAYFESNLNQPEYDLLSRQPTEYIEESYRIMNLDKSSRSNPLKRITTTADKNNLSFSFDAQTTSPVMKINKNTPKISSTNVRDANFRTSGVRPSAKKGHTVQSPLQVQKNRSSKVGLSSTSRVLKTITPSATFSSKMSSESSSKVLRPHLNKSKKNRNKVSDPPRGNRGAIESSTERANEAEAPKKSFGNNKPKRRNKLSRSRTLKHESTAINTLKSKTNEHTPENDSSLSVYTFKLNRTPGRWQYKTSPKPKVNIRKPAGDANISYIYSNETISSADQARNGSPKLNAVSDQIDLESSGSQNGAIVNNVKADTNKYLVETINIEISTPSDFQDKYYEIATIKTPYTFQVGVLKKTRLITVTSTFEKFLEPQSTSAESFDGPLTENILKTTKLSPQLLDGSITTLSPIFLTDDEETPKLETLTETYTLTQAKLGTEVVPIINEAKNYTSFISAIQTFAIKNIITVTKTVFHGLDDRFASLNNLKDFNMNLDEAGSEINLELDFGDQDNSESGNADKLPPQKDALNGTAENFSLLPLNIDTSQLQHYLVSNLYNKASQNSGLTLNTLIKPQPLWESYVVQIKNGASTSFRTLSKLIGVVDKSEHIMETITPAFDPQISTNPFALPPPQLFQTVTTQLVQQEIVTETNSKVLKLTFGAKTAYTTLFSTNVVPKVVTSYLTTVVPVQPPPNFPGYYPPPYHPFPYVG